MWEPFRGSQALTRRLPRWNELRANLKEVLELCLEESVGTFEDLPRVIGLEQVDVAG